MRRRRASQGRSPQQVRAAEPLIAHSSEISLTPCAPAAYPGRRAGELADPAPELALRVGLEQRDPLRRVDRAQREDLGVECRDAPWREVGHADHEPALELILRVPRAHRDGRAAGAPTAEDGPGLVTGGSRARGSLRPAPAAPAPPR